VWLDEPDGSLAGVMVMSVTEIFYLVTASEFRRRGVASDLIDHAISNVRRRYRVGVTARAREENTPIVRLLLKKGLLSASDFTVGVSGLDGVRFRKRALDPATHG
jgi:ribosomal protein S18 acetylase RimI-like enzyme